jgi:signal peptidase I
MLQYLKFNENTVDTKRYELMKGKKVYFFLAKLVLVTVFMFYATLFVAVATPFLRPNHPAIYIIGGIISSVILVRTLVFFSRFLSFGSGAFTVSKKGITVSKNGRDTEIAAVSIVYLEYNLFGDLVVKEKERSTPFPVHFLEPKDKRELLLLFADMTPSRTAFLHKIWELGDAIVVAMILAVHIIQFLVQNFFIPTGSMISTLMINDHLFAEKLTYGPRIPRMAGMDSEIHMKIPLISRDVRKNDIIIFNPPAGEVDKDYIKRCIAVAGDEYHIKGGSVYVNGKRLEEKYTTGTTNPGPISLEGIVPKGMVIAMGDNREHSFDSRYFGYVPVERIKARALLLYFNWDQIRQFDFSRFGLIR